MALHRIKKLVYTITTAGANYLTANQNTEVLNGYLVGMKVVSPPAVDNTATLATTLADDDSASVSGLASGFTAQAVNTTVTQHKTSDTNPVPLQRAVFGLLTITVTLSANQTVGRVVVVTLYIDTLQL